MARPSALADPDYAKQVAEAFAQGATRAGMAETFNVSRETITRWRKDPRVKRLLHNLIVERVQRVVSKVDTILEARLAEHGDSLTTKELIDIRKEFMGDGSRAKLDEADGDTINAAAEAADNPDFMKAVQEMLAGRGAPPE